MRVAQVVEAVSAKTGIPMAKLAIAWPLGRRFVASVIVGVRTQDQLAANLEPGDWDVPTDVWKGLEEQTRPEEEYQTWFNKMAYRSLLWRCRFPRRARRTAVADWLKKAHLRPLPRSRDGCGVRAKYALASQIAWRLVSGPF